MSAQPKKQTNSRAEGYRELSMQALNSVTEYKVKAQHYSALGQADIAAEYQQLATEAIARAERYMILADFAECNAEENQKAS